ncbi:amidohydrolase family protein, partial [Roseateles sp. GG27B]
AEAGQKIGFMQVSDKPAGKIAIVGARIATMKGDEVISTGVIVVDGNRIAAIGKLGEVAIPADAKQIDARGKTVIPGLIDAHWHGGMAESEIIRSKAGSTTPRWPLA